MSARAAGIAARSPRASAIEGRGVAKPLLKLIAFAAVTLTLTALLAQTLGAFGFGGGPEYRARFADVTGLLVGDDVRVAGVKVGRVTGIDLVRSGDGAPEAEVSFTAEDVPLATTVRAKIRYRNLVGQRYLALAEGPGGGARLAERGVIPLAQTTPALDLTVVFNGFRPLFTGLSPQDVNTFAFEIIQVLQGEGGTLSDLLRRTASVTNTLADRDAVIGRVITNLTAILGTLDERDAKLSETIRQMQLLVSGLAADRAAIGGALTNISGLADATTSLLREARPSLAADISALNTLAGTLVENSAVIESTLSRAPARLDALTRTASYGSWFNFFLCDFDGRVTLGSTSLRPTTFSSSGAKCGGA